MKGRKIVDILDLIIVLLILFIINFLVYNHYFRIDFTKNKVYSVSSGLKHIIEKLDDRVNINVYFSKDLPSYLQTLARDVYDILDEIQAVSDGKIVVKKIDPEIDEQTESKVRALGIPKIQMNVFEKQKAEIKNGYMGIAIIYQDKHEVIPVVKDLSSLEYEIALAIKKVSASEKPKIAYYKTKSSPSLEDYNRFNQNGSEDNNLELLKKLLDKNYDIKIYKTNSKELIPTNISAMMLIDPQELTKRDLFVIEQYLMNGGNLIVFQNSYTTEGMFGQGKTVDINKLLENFGLKIEEGAAIDKYCQQVAFGGQGFFQVIADYPFFISVLPEFLNKELPITSKLSTITLPWASPINITHKDSIDVHVLAYSSPYSGHIKSSYLSLSPQQHFNFNQDSLVLAVYARGKMKSIFNKYIPYDSTDRDTTFLAKAVKTANLIVIPSSKIVESDFLQRFSENVPFILNCIDYLAQDPYLIEIRSKIITKEPIKELSPKMIMLVKATNIVIVPLLLIIFGIIFNIKRKKGIELS